MDKSTRFQIWNGNERNGNERNGNEMMLPNYKNPSGKVNVLTSSVVYMNIHRYVLKYTQN